MTNMSIETSLADIDPTDTQYTLPSDPCCLDTDPTGILCKTLDLTCLDIDPLGM